LLRLTVPLARVAVAIVKEKAWFSFGFARAEDFARERLGRSRRWLGDLASLHEAMEALPGLEAALTGGDGGPPIGRVAALLIGRIGSPATAAKWIALAQRSSVREFREAVRRARAAGVDSPMEADASGEDRAAAEDPTASGSATQIIRATDGAPAAGIEEDDPADRLLVRVPVSRVLRAAFDEAVDLFRAVEGTEATVTSFVEALVAETSAGDSLPVAGDISPDADSAPITRGTGLGVIEMALARSTGNWQHLPVASGSSPAFAPAEACLASLEEIARRAGSGAPADLLDQMRALVALESEIEVRLGRLLAAMAEDGAWARLRFAGLGHYAEERLGLSRTTAGDRARASRALRRFPHLREAYESDRLGLEAALTVARILNDVPAGTTQDGSVAEEAWVARAQEVTVKRLRDEARLLFRRAAMAGRIVPQRAGSEQSPGNGRRPGEQPSGERWLHHPPDDSEWHASLRRGPGTARRRIFDLGMLAAGLGSGAGPGADAEAQVDNIAGLGTDAADAGAEPAEGDIAIVATPETALIPEPDVFLRLRLPADLAGRFLATIEAARRRLTAAAEAIPWDDPWPDSAALSSLLPSHLAARTFSIRCRRVPSWVGLLALIEEFVLTWDSDARGTTPARDRIYIRDGWRCTAPGCSSRRNLEDHHVLYRSRGGGKGESNRTCLCRFHHQRGEHGGLASCSGEAPLGLSWRLGRAGQAEWYRNERRLGPEGLPPAPASVPSTTG
jgi:hypothetical protein